MRSAHQRAKQIALRLMPKSKRQLAHRIAQQRVVVLKAKKRWREADNPKDRLIIARDLVGEAKTLRRMVRGAEQSAKATTHVENLVPVQARARKVVVLARLKQVGNAMQRIRKASRTANGVSAKRRLAIQHTMLQAHQKLLLRRLQLLKHNQDIEQGPQVHPTQVAIQRVRLTMPQVYEVPTAGELIVATRLLAASLTRNSSESDRMFRARLRAYTKRAVVRFLNKRQQMSPNDALVAAVEETIDVDAPAIEAEADAGGFVADPVADTTEGLLEPIADEIDSVVVDIQPEVEEADPSVDEVDDILAEAETVESDLASQPEEVQDMMTPPELSPSRDGGRVDGFVPSGEDAAPSTTPIDGDSELPPAPPLMAAEQVPEPVELPPIMPSPAVSVSPMLLDLDAALYDAGVDTDRVFQVAEGKARTLDERLQDKTDGKVSLKTVLGGLFVVGTIYLLTRRS